MTLGRVRAISCGLTALAILPALAAETHLARTNEPEALTRYEAEILIYLLPEGHANRLAGRDIAWELQTNPALNQADYFHFWVFGTPAPPGAGSVTVGYFAVNRHTAEVWCSDAGKRVSSPELRGVQEILRRVHNIGPEVLVQFGNKALWADKAPRPHGQ